MQGDTTGEPTPIALSQVAPELRDRIRSFPRLPITNGTARWLLRGISKLFARDKSCEGVQLQKHRTKAGADVRVFVPDARAGSAALLWIHGGGLVIGNAAQDDLFCAETARELGIVVVAAEYRLAPEFPFPAALEDCFSAWAWLLESAQQFRIDPLRVAVGGQSAGGGLAASLAQRIHDAGGAQPAAQWLFSPMLDDRTALARELDVVGHYVWDNRQNRFGWQAYLGDTFGTPQVPDHAVPARRSSLEGLPPAWIGVGDIDLFFHEAAAYAERLNAAGTACALDVVPGAPHGFETIAPDAELVKRYLARGRAWLREALQPVSPFPG